jgi:hypothetical protein
MDMTLVYDPFHGKSQRPLPFRFILVKVIINLVDNWT